MLILSQYWKCGIKYVAFICSHILNNIKKYTNISVTEKGLTASKNPCWKYVISTYLLHRGL